MKNKKGKISEKAHAGQRKNIINIYNEKKAQFPEMGYKEIIKLVGNTCGVGYRTVVDSLKELKKTKKWVRPDIMQKMSEEEIGAIRKHVHALLGTKRPTDTSESIGGDPKRRKFTNYIAEYVTSPLHHYEEIELQVRTETTQ